MYNILCASLVRSRGPIANFTHTYKKVANRYQLGQCSGAAREPLESRDEKDKEPNTIKPTIASSKNKQSLPKLGGPKSAELLRNSSIKYVIPKSRFSPFYFPNNSIKYNQQVQNFSKKSFLMQTVTKKPNIVVQNLSKKSTSMTFTKKPTTFAYCINQGKNYSTKKFFLNEKALESYKNAMKRVNNIAKLKNPDLQWKELSKKFESNILDQNLFPMPKEKKAKANITYPIKYAKHNMKVHKRFKIRDGITDDQAKLLDTSKNVNLVKPVKNPRKIGSNDLIQKLLKTKKQSEELQKINKINVKSKVAQRADTNIKPIYRIVKAIPIPAKLTISEILQKEANVNKIHAKESKVARKKADSKIVKTKIIKKPTVSNFIVAEESTENEVLQDHLKPPKICKSKKPKTRKQLTEKISNLEGEVTKKHAKENNYTTKEIEAVVLDFVNSEPQSLQVAPVSPSIKPEDAKQIKTHPEVKTAPKELKRKLKNKFMGLLLKKQSLPKIAKVKAKLLEQPVEKENEAKIESEENSQKIEDVLNMLKSEEGKEIKNDTNRVAIKEELQCKVNDVQPQIMTEQDESIFNKRLPKDVWGKTTTQFEIDKICIKENTNNYQNVTDLETSSVQSSKSNDNILKTEQITKGQTDDIQTVRNNFEKEAQTLTNFVDKLKSLKEKSSVNDIAQFRQPRSKSVDSATKKSAFALKIEALTKGMPTEDTEIDVRKKTSLGSFENAMDSVKLNTTNLETAKKLLEYKIEQLQLKEQLVDISKKLMDLENKQSDVLKNTNIIEAKNARESPKPQDSRSIKDVKKNQEDKIKKNKMQQDPYDDQDREVIIAVDEKAKPIDETKKNLLSKRSKDQVPKKISKLNQRVLTLSEKLTRSEKVKEQLQKLNVKPVKHLTVRNQTNKTKSLPTINPDQLGEKKVDKLNKMAQLNANYADNLRKKEEEIIEIKKLRDKFNSQSSLKSRVPRKEGGKLTKNQQEIESKRDKSEKVKQHIDKFEIARRIAAQMRQKNVSVIKDKNKSKSVLTEDHKNLDKTETIATDKEKIQSRSTSVLIDKKKTPSSLQYMTNQDDAEAFYVKKQKEWDRLINGDNLKADRPKNPEANIKKLENMLNDAEKQIFTGEDEPNMFKKILKQYANIVEDKIEEIKSTVIKKSSEKQQKPANIIIKTAYEKGVNIIDHKVEAMKQNVVNIIDNKVNEIKQNVYKKTFDKDKTGGPKLTVEVEVKSEMPEYKKILEKKDSVQENLQKIVSCPSVAVELLKKKKNPELEKNLDSETDPIKLKININSPKNIKVKDTVILNKTSTALLIDYKTGQYYPEDNKHDSLEQFLTRSKAAEKNLDEKHDNSENYKEIIVPNKSQVIFCKDTFQRFEEKDKKSESIESLLKTEIGKHDSQETTPKEKQLVESHIGENPSPLQTDEQKESLKPNDDILLYSNNLSTENVELLKELEKISLEFAESMLKKDIAKEATKENIKTDPEKCNNALLDKVLAHKNTIIEQNINTLEDLAKVNEFLNKLEDLEQKVLFEKSSSNDVEVGNKIRIPPPPKPESNKQQNIKKEKPKSPKDMVLPPRIKGREPKDIKDTEAKAGNKIISDEKVIEKDINIITKNENLIQDKATVEKDIIENRPELLMHKNKDFSDVIFLKKQTISADISPLETNKDKNQVLSGLQKMKFEIEVTDTKPYDEKSKNEGKGGKKPLKGPGLTIEQKLSATDTKSYEVKIEKNSEPKKTYVEKYLGPANIAKQSHPKSTIEKYVWEEELVNDGAKISHKVRKTVSREQLKKTVILVFNRDNNQQESRSMEPQKSKSDSLFPEVVSNKNDLEFLQHNIVRNNHTYDLTLDLPHLDTKVTPSSSRTEFLSKNITKSAIRPSKSMSELKHQKPDTISNGGNSRTLCQKSGKDEDAPEIRKMKECLKERQTKATFEWPRRKGHEKNDDQKDSCKKKKEDPCKKQDDVCKEDPCKKKQEDTCKKQKEDPCKKKQDDICKKKCSPSGNTEKLECPARKSEKIGEPMDVSKAKLKQINKLQSDKPESKVTNDENTKAIFFLAKENVLILKRASNPQIQENNMETIDQNIKITRESDKLRKEVVTKYISPSLNQEKNIVANITQFIDKPKVAKSNVEVKVKHYDDKNKIKNVDYLFISDNGQKSYITAKIVNVLDKSEYTKLKENNTYKKFNKNLLDNSKSRSNPNIRDLLPQYQQNTVGEADLDGIPIRSNFCLNYQKSERMDSNNRVNVQPISRFASRFNKSKSNKDKTTETQLKNASQNKKNDDKIKKFKNIQDKVFNSKSVEKKDQISVAKKVEKSVEDPEHQVLCPKDPNITDSCRILGTTSKIHNHRFPENDLYTLKIQKNETYESSNLFKDTSEASRNDMYSLKLNSEKQKLDTHNKDKFCAQKNVKSDMYTLNVSKNSEKKAKIVLKSVTERSETKYWSYYDTSEKIPAKLTCFKEDLPDNLFHKRLSFDNNLSSQPKLTSASHNDISKVMKYTKKYSNVPQNSPKHSVEYDSCFSDRTRNYAMKPSKTKVVTKKSQIETSSKTFRGSSGSLDDSVIVSRHKFDHTHPDNFKGSGKHALEIELLDEEKIFEFDTVENGKKNTQNSGYQLKDSVFADRTQNMSEITGHMRENSTTQFLKDKGENKFDKSAKNTKKQETNRKDTEVSKPSGGIPDFDSIENRMSKSYYLDQIKNQKVLNLNREKYNPKYKNLKGRKYEPFTENDYYSDRDYVDINIKKSGEILKPEIISALKQNLDETKVSDHKLDDSFSNSSHLNKKNYLSNKNVHEKLSKKINKYDSKNEHTLDSSCSKENKTIRKKIIKGQELQINNLKNIYKTELPNKDMKFVKNNQKIDHKYLKPDPMQKYLTDQDYLEKERPSKDNNYLVNKAKSEIITMNLDKEVLEKLLKYFENKHKSPKIEDALLKFTTADPLIEKYLKEHKDKKAESVKKFKSSSEIQKSRKQLALDSIEHQLKIDYSVEDEIERQVFEKKRNIMNRKKLKNLVQAIEEFDEELKKCATSKDQKKDQLKFVNKNSLQQEIEEKILEDKKKKFKRRKNEAKVIKKEHRDKKIGIKTTTTTRENVKQVGLNVASPEYKKKLSKNDSKSKESVKTKVDNNKKETAEDLEKSKKPVIINPPSSMKNPSKSCHYSKNQPKYCSCKHTLCLPTNNLSLQALKDPLDTCKTTLDKKLEIKNLCPNPKILKQTAKYTEMSKVLDKYKHLKITYMTVIRQPAKKIVKDEDEYEINRREIMKNLRSKKESQWTLKEKPDIKNYRYELLKKLNEEWGKQSKNEVISNENKLDHSIKFKLNPSKQGKLSDIVDKILTEHFKQKAKFSDEEENRRNVSSDTVKSNPSNSKMTLATKLAKPAVKSTKSFATVAEYVWNISEENSNKNSKNFHSNNTLGNKVQDPTNTTKRNFSTFSGIRFCKSDDKTCNSKKSEDEKVCESLKKKHDCETFRSSKADDKICGSKISQDEEVCESLKNRIVDDKICGFKKSEDEKVCDPCERLLSREECPPKQDCEIFNKSDDILCNSKTMTEDEEVCESLKNPPPCPKFCERLPKRECEPVKQDCELCDEPEECCIHPPDKCHKEDAMCREFDLECEIPHAFECPSRRLRDQRKCDLYYKTHKTTFNDIYVWLSKKRAINQDKDGKEQK